MRGCKGRHIYVRTGGIGPRHSDALFPGAEPRVKSFFLHVVSGSNGRPRPFIQSLGSQDWA